MFFSKKENETIKNSIEGAEKNEEEKASSPIDDMAIKAMPEEYRYNRQTVQKTNKFGLWLVVSGGLLMLLSIAALTYYVYNNSDLNKNKVIAPQKEIPAKSEQPKELPKEATPQEEYLKINQEFADITDWQGLENFILKYGSPAKVAQYNTVKAKIVQASDDQKQQVIAAYIKSAPRLNASDKIKETVSANQATLEIVLPSGINGTIVLSKLNGQWKLDSDNWINNGQDAKLESLIDQIIASPATTTAATTTEVEQPIAAREFKPGKDSDNDGLTDKEEAALGTDPDKQDSDSDGYSDYAEVSNLYLPLGNGKLFATDLFTRYPDNEKYILYYPSGWDVSVPTAGDTAIFKSKDNHFLQAAIQANSNGEKIDQWYQRQFNVSSVDVNNYMAGDTWEGIKSADGLNVYLTDLERKHIFVLTYNPGVNETIEYLHFFEILVKSFSLVN